MQWKIVNSPAKNEFRQFQKADWRDFYPRAGKISVNPELISLYYPPAAGRFTYYQFIEYQANSSTISPGWKTLSKRVLKNEQNTTKRFYFIAIYGHFVS